MFHETPKTQAGSEPIPMEFFSFLQESPPGTFASCADAATVNRHGGLVLAEPEVLLWCGHEQCGRTMLFEAVDDNGLHLSEDSLKHVFLTVRCKHCEKTTKTYALRVLVRGAECLVAKIGEWPPFAPHVPARVLRLVQPDVGIFNQGRRAESLNLGIGALAYYRRVVERQKDALFEAIISVARKTGSSDDVIKDLEKAKSSFQFSRSVEDFKKAIPAALLIDGYNPLILLHKALSIGIHNESDTECLERASDIRLVLTELAERVSIVLRDKGELDKAVNRLLRSKTTK